MYIRRLDDKVKIIRFAASAMSLTLLAAATVGAGRAQAASGDLAAFLARAKRMSTLTKPVRADVTVTRADRSTDQAILIVDPRTPGSQYMSVAASGWRSLMPLAWKPGHVVRKTSAEPKSFGPDEPIAGTDLRPMDFFAPWAQDFDTAFISDESRLEKTVTLYAAPGTPYSLYVVTFDKAMIVPRVIKYYRGDFTNLVRLREDSDYTMVGSRPLPQAITIHDYTENSQTGLRLKWSVLEHVPNGLLNIDTFYKTAFK